ncbi:hypothetical protein [Paracoccus mutanolyticus]|uniref:hypothetical protein n=1 Tax=Paracoccus mutanolyticus TaxID=1499308 RepID=UPI001CB9CEF3|nr:hypothetical protein [Paracoccus mutanolyticus]
MLDIGIADDGIPVAVVVTEPTGSETQIFARVGEDLIDAVVKDRIRAEPGSRILGLTQAEVFKICRERGRRHCAARWSSRVDRRGNGARARGQGACPDQCLAQAVMTAAAWRPPWPARRQSALRSGYLNRGGINDDRRLLNQSDTMQDMHVQPVRELVAVVRNRCLAPAHARLCRHPHPPDAIAGQAQIVALVLPSVACAVLDKVVAQLVQHRLGLADRDLRLGCQQSRHGLCLRV